MLLVSLLQREQKEQKGQMGSAEAVTLAGLTPPLPLTSPLPIERCG